MKRQQTVSGYEYAYSVVTDTTAAAVTIGRYVIGYILAVAEKQKRFRKKTPVTVTDAYTYRLHKKTTII